jgi:hypothetical protein
MKTTPPPPPDPPPLPPKVLPAASDVPCNGDQCSLWYEICLLCRPVFPCLFKNSCGDCTIIRKMTVEEMVEWTITESGLFYYRYVTNIYSITGSKNRAKLPKCHWSAIYTKFQEWSKSSTGTTSCQSLLFLIMTSCTISFMIVVESVDTHWRWPIYQSYYKFNIFTRFAFDTTPFLAFFLGLSRSVAAHWALLSIRSFHTSFDAPLDYFD